MANDVYTANEDGSCYVGMFNTITGIAQGGTVNILAADVAASGFTLLTTAPASSIYRNHPHSGCAWDEPRQTMWIFGAETHSVASNYDNSVYCFDVHGGLFKKMYDQSPWLGEYNINADGFLYADDAETLPWAVHTYQRLHYNPQTSEIAIPVDMNFHAYTTPAQKGSIDLASRKNPILIYNTVSKSWRYDWTPAVQSFMQNGAIHGAAYSSEWGWVSSYNANLLHLTADLSTFSSIAQSGKINNRMHDSAFFMGDRFIKFGAAVVQTGILFSVHPMNNLAASYNKQIQDFPALSGWYVTNKAAVPINDTQILFLAQNDSGEIGAFIYDFDLDSVTDTGHILTGAVSSYSVYNFKLAWSKKLNAAICPLDSMASPLKVYLLRL